MVRVNVLGEVRGCGQRGLSGVVIRRGMVGRGVIELTPLIMRSDAFLYMLVHSFNRIECTCPRRLEEGTKGGRGEEGREGYVRQDRLRITMLSTYQVFTRRHSGRGSVALSITRHAHQLGRSIHIILLGYTIASYRERAPIRIAHLQTYTS